MKLSVENLDDRCLPSAILVSSMDAPVPPPPAIVAPMNPGATPVPPSGDPFWIGINNSSGNNHWNWYLNSPNPGDGYDWTLPSNPLPPGTIIQIPIPLV